MSNKKILFVDDRKALGSSLSTELGEQGYDVYYTDKVTTAKALADEHWETLDVAVLDMRLEDINYPNITGADIGISMRESKNSFPPEFLIYSAFDEKDYYQLAIDLGVAAYLPKEGENLMDLIRHIKVLALRHTLNASNPRNVNRITSIAAESRSFPDAVTKFCKEILEREFDSCLRAPFVILFGANNNQTYNCANNVNLPKGSYPVYHTLQTLTHGESDSLLPFIFDMNSIQLPVDEPFEHFPRKLNHAVFMPLPISKDFCLSIGILQDKQNKLAEEAEPLVRILQKYLRDTLNEQINRLWFQWERYKILTIQSNTAKFCGFVGQEIKDLIEEGEEDLQELADDLIDTGSVLWNSLTRSEKTNDCISIKDLANDTWAWIEKSSEAKSLKLPVFNVEEDFQILGNREDLEVAFARLLHWLAQRAAATPMDLEPTVTIRGRKINNNEVHVFFEDRSRRLDPKLRAEIFFPLTQSVPIPFGNLIKQNNKVSGKYLPLFLAKTLVPSLTDCSDDDDLKNKPYGHRFMMQFPLAESFS